NGGASCRFPLRADSRSCAVFAAATIEFIRLFNVWSKTSHRTPPSNDGGIVTDSRVFTQPESSLIPLAAQRRTFRCFASAPQSDISAWPAGLLAPRDAIRLGQQKGRDRERELKFHQRRAFVVAGRTYTHESPEQLFVNSNIWLLTFAKTEVCCYSAKNGA